MVAIRYLECQTAPMVVAISALLMEIKMAIG
jgi:hypothetical protein